MEYEQQDAATAGALQAPAGAAEFVVGVLNGVPAGHAEAVAAVRLQSHGFAARPAQRTLRTSRAQAAAKRLVDIVVSSVLLLLLAPALLVLALAIWLESPGPIFYRAVRIGHCGRAFHMLKFRKMREGVTGPAITTASDPRFTRMGGALARYKLDELPQLWNVLRGQMSLVGPRPAEEEYVSSSDEPYRTILTARQGITGLSQLAFFEESRILDGEDVLGRYESRILPQKLALDQLYVERATLVWDLRILAWSVVSCVLRRPVAVDRRTGALGLRRR